MSSFPQGPGWWQASDGLWYPPQPAYPSAPSIYPQTAARTSGAAIGALVLAIVSFFVCPVIPAIAALALASSATSEIRASGGWVTGEGLVTAARIVAWLNIGLVLAAILVIILARTVAMN